MWARAALVCALLTAPGISHAERLPVAVVDLVGGADSPKLAIDLRAELVKHPDLQRVLLPADETALVGPFPDDDTSALDTATRQLKAADAELAQFQLADAKSQAHTGQRSLLLANPPATINLYAELTLTLAIAQFQSHEPEAAAGFALVHRLAPKRALDPVRYLPELVEAFDQARALRGNGTLEIRGHGEVWLDGVDTGGQAPRSIDVAAGAHYVQLAGDDRMNRGEPAIVADGAKVVVDIEDAPAGHDLEIRRTRARLAHAPDAVARASAMQHLARLVGVADALLIEDGRVEIWRASSGFHEIKDAGKIPVIDLLAPIAPPRAAPPKEQPLPIVPEDTRWYLDRRYQVGIGAAVLAAAITTIVLTTGGTNSSHPIGPTMIVK